MYALGYVELVDRDARQVVALRLGVGLEQFPLELLAFAIFSGLIALFSWPGRQESNLHHEVRSLGGYPLPHDRIASRAFDAERHSHPILSQNRFVIGARLALPACAAL